MSNRFMISVAAAALIAGTGFAYAQGTGMSREAPSTGSTVQQSAPTPNKDATEPTKPSSGMKATQADEKAAQPNGAKNQHAQDNVKTGPTSEKSAQDTGMKGEKSKSMSSETYEKGAAGKDMKAEGANGNMNAETKSATEAKPQTTTGQAGAGAKLSTEQRTRISTVIKEQHIQPTANVNFSISVGTRVPHDVGFHPLPVEIVTIYPDWRGYEMILVGNQIVVVNPRTFEIVAVLDV